MAKQPENTTETKRWKKHRHKPPIFGFHHVGNSDHQDDITCLVMNAELNLTTTGTL